jgi:hypothetical protein
MKKFKVTYRPTKKRKFIVEAESVSQAFTLAEIERKEQFDSISYGVSIVEHHEPKPE